MPLNPLLPDRHPQRNFFIADLFDNLPIKDDVASMERPFFTLSTRPDIRTLEFTDGDKSVKVVPSSLGLPTIFDKDILLYCASQVMERINRGEEPQKTIRFSIHDFMIATNRNICGDAYDRFEKALLRLTGCVVETNIKTGDTEQRKGFGLINEYEYLKNNHVKRRIIGIEVMLSDWFYNSLIAKEVLTIDRDYFRLRKPIERRVYEIARKHCGEKSRWNISLKRLYEKSGALSAIKHFRAAVKELAKHDHLPEYFISFNVEKNMVTFRYRGATTDRPDDDQGELFGDAPPAIPTQIPPDLLVDVRQVVGTGLDYYDLWHQYINWSGSKKARSVRGGFIGFCQTKAAKSMRL